MPHQTVWFGHYANNDFGGEKFTRKQGTHILNVRKFFFQVLICCPTNHYQLVSFVDSSIHGRLDWIAKLGQGRQAFVHCFPR
jgi:hypothetical protein